jgi:hypothetical protein
MGDIFLAAKAQGREADHLPPTSAEVKRTWLYTFTLTYLYVFMVKPEDMALLFKTAATLKIVPKLIMYIIIQHIQRAGTAQSEKRLATGSKDMGSEIESR